MTERIEVQRTIAAPAADIFAVLCDPQGHVAIDASGMLQDADGEPARRSATRSWCTWTARRSTTSRSASTTSPSRSREFEQDRVIAWTILGQIQPPIGHVYGYRLEPTDDGTLVTSYYDWSDIDPAVAGGRHLPGHPRERAARHARHPRPHGPARLPAGRRHGRQPLVDEASAST